MSLLESTFQTVAHPERIAVIGAGYVGIPTAVTLAHFGHSVIIAERDEFRRESIRSGRSPILEEGLEDVLAAVVKSGQLEVTDDAVKAVAGAKFVFLCVATPMDDDGRANLWFVDSVSREIAHALRDDAIVVNKSTVPVGTMERVTSIIGRSGVRVVSNPEFLREGTALGDSLKPDRIVVGAEDREAAQNVAQLFASTGAPVVVTDATTSELIKYASNAFLATKLSFINTMSRLCDQLGADVADLVRGMGSDHRIGFPFLNPGPGWGGSCLPKDTSALVAIASDAGLSLDVVRAAIESNAAQQRHIVTQVAAMVGGSLSGKTVAVLGLTFKANTGDRRDSPALQVAELLLAAGARLQAFDPTVAADDSSSDVANLGVCATLEEAVVGVDVTIVLTEWAMFSSLEWSRLVPTMAQPCIYDARGVVDLEAARAAGATVRSTGRS
jgi:UDPglucose 6-dehydrogenase